VVEPQCGRHQVVVAAAAASLRLCHTALNHVGKLSLWEISSCAQSGTNPGNCSSSPVGRISQKKAAHRGMYVAWI